MEAYAEQKQQVAIQKCASCGKFHKMVELRKYLNPATPFTHYYMCPETGEPVSLSIAARGTSIVELHNKVCDSLVQAEAAGSYMAVVFYPVETADGMSLMLDRVTWNFSSKRFDECLDLFRKNLQKETHAPEKAELVIAPPPMPEINLWGKAEDGKPK